MNEYIREIIQADVQDSGFYDETLEGDNTTTLVETPVYDGEMSWLCKNCGETLVFPEETPLEAGYKYCCTCGAKIIEYSKYYESEEE